MERRRIMKFWKTGVLVIGVLMFLYPAVAKADGDSPPGRWWKIPGLVEKLNLSPQEQQALDGLFTQKRKVLFDMRSEVEKQRFALEDILEEANLDQRAAFEQFNRLEQKRARLSVERFRYLLEVRKILGRDRYLKLMDMARERRERRGHSPEDELTPR
jgi:Spy/CpxP family protein refolding chaperone